MVDTAPLPSVVSLSDRAVDAEWLWLWCEKHDLWDKSTEDVVEEIVKPLTEHLQCRFVELASQFGSGRRLSSVAPPLPSGAVTSRCSR